MAPAVVVRIAAVHLAEHAVVVLKAVEVHMVAVHIVVDLADSADTVKSEFQNPYLCIHHALHFAH